MREQSSAISYAPTMTAFLAIVLSFLLGSVPISWLVGKIKYNIDLRTFGDGNVGAGNLQHATGLKIGIFAIFADLAKGSLAVGLTVLLDNREWVIMVAGTAAVIGHIVPPWLRFHGGRGAATALGVALAIIPIPGAITLPIGLLMILEGLTCSSTMQGLPFLVLVKNTPLRIGIERLALIYPHRFYYAN